MLCPGVSPPTGFLAGVLGMPRQAVADAGVPEGWREVARLVRPTEVAAVRNALAGIEAGWRTWRPN